VVLERLEVAEWFAVDDCLRRMIIARAALRCACRRGHDTGADDRPAVNLENLDAIPTLPLLTRVASRMSPAQLSVPAFRLPGCGVCSSGGRARGRRGRGAENGSSLNWAFAQNGGVGRRAMQVCRAYALHFSYDGFPYTLPALLDWLADHLSMR
jgi:hypothetical protein